MDRMNSHYAQFPALGASPSPNRRVSLALSIPLWLHKRPLDRADAVGVSVSALVTDLLEASTDAAQDAGEKELGQPIPTVG